MSIFRVAYWDGGYWWLTGINAPFQDAALGEIKENRLIAPADSFGEI